VSLPPFEEVVAEYGPVVLRVCRAVLGPTDAADAWSETNIEAWLVTIAHRRAIDVGRALTRTAVPAETLPERAAPNVDPAGYDPDLWAALAALPTKQRQAVAYHYLAGLPHAEIAQLLGNSTDAARRAAADGLKKLRKLYPKDRA
jgi:RNA polymerase sigma factor (sigma-70 family)